MFSHITLRSNSLELTVFETFFIHIPIELLFTYLHEANTIQIYINFLIATLLASRNINKIYKKKHKYSLFNIYRRIMKKIIIKYLKN